MKEFFGITNKYKFEITDLSAILTVLNVTFILGGFWWAPLFGLVNCCLVLVINIKNHVHLNMYIIQIALIILNIYFLTL